MRFLNPLANGWTDLNESSFYFFPNVLIRAAEVAAKRIEAGGDMWHASVKREVLYEDANGNKYRMTLRPYTHPTGAANLSLGSIADNADGTRTFTISAEGKLVGWDGALTGVGDNPDDVAGLLIGDYFTHFTDNAYDFDEFRVEEIEAGDFLWVVQAGDVELLSTGTVNVGEPLVCAATGQIEEGTAVDVTNTTTLSTTLRDHEFGPGSRPLAVAVASATSASAGLKSCSLRLPDVHS
jgi:hypothetical protein